MENSTGQAGGSGAQWGGPGPEDEQHGEMNFDQGPGGPDAGPQDLIVLGPWADDPELNFEQRLGGPDAGPQDLIVLGPLAADAELNFEQRPGGPDAGPQAGPSHGRPLPVACEVSRTPGGSMMVGDAIILDGRQAWNPPTTPVIASPSSTPRRRAGRPRRRRRPQIPRQASLNLPDNLVLNYAADSDTDEDGEDEVEDEDDLDDALELGLGNLRRLRQAARELAELVEGGEGGEIAGEEEQVQEEQVQGGGDRGDPVPDNIRGQYEFEWTEDYGTFAGVQEEYQRTPGPSYYSLDPLDIFLQIWDRDIVNDIVIQTNLYAEQVISALAEHENNVPKYLDNWHETTVEEMYRYFAVLMYMALAPRGQMADFWCTDVMEMPGFRAIMPRNRFTLLSRFLHFVNNEVIPHNLGVYSKKVAKIAPILEHCNNKFAALYTPQQQLSIDESLLLWKGRLSWVQCIRTKAARFGIKTFELCEATTGYMLRCIIYAGKGTSMHAGPLHGFTAPTAKVVLKLMEGYLDVGHLLVMDNWYNQLDLTRYLKHRQTDVLGTLNRRRQNVPEIVKTVDDRRMQDGQRVSTHCGDIAVTAWKDKKVVTIISTYHPDGMVPGRRAGRPRETPSAVAEYNRYMGGVDLKDQKLSMYLLERKRGTKWYMKVFRRLLNTSLLNSYVIYCRVPTTHRVMTHRQFRERVALSLIERFARPAIGIARPLAPPRPATLTRLNSELQHFPQSTRLTEHRKLYQRRCARCTAVQARKLVTVECSACGVGLCLGQCWREYHTLVDITQRPG